MTAIYVCFLDLNRDLSCRFFHNSETFKEMLKPPLERLPDMASNLADNNWQTMFTSTSPGDGVTGAKLAQPAQPLNVGPITANRILFSHHAGNPILGD